MKLFKAAAGICFQDILQWKKDCKFWCVILVLVLYIGLYTQGTAEYAREIGGTISFWSLPFIMSDQMMRLVVLSAML